MRSITEMNDLMWAEFRRVSGTLDTFLFPVWWAACEKQLIRLQADDRDLANARWAALSRAERQTRLAAFVAAMPEGAGP